jgi:hypothetical protein
VAVNFKAGVAENREQYFVGNLFAETAEAKSWARDRVQGFAVRQAKSPLNRVPRARTADRYYRDRGAAGWSQYGEMERVHVDFVVAR